MTKAVRVRFAPSPTGLMHLGNVRAALINFLFARHHNGTFILRIEDTDPERNFDPGGQIIINDLNWLGLSYDEGPNKNEKFGPYLQSQRTAIYHEYIAKLTEKGLAYRCFCTQEELEKKRERQIALKKPPRYDRACLKLSAADIQSHVDAGTPFVWRVKIDETAVIEITDLAHGAITFEMHNFSDFPITRQDGTVTFIFANFIDDMLMEITHVFRGEDHLSNTANQSILYRAFNAPLPTFWHLPMICNAEGKKLSKRDFGFSLQDLQSAGFLPEAVCNYLGIIGCGSFEQEIMALPDLARAINFEKQSSTGAIRYDVEKLKWVNHKWIEKIPTTDLMVRAIPFIAQRYPQVADLEQAKLLKLIEIMKPSLTTLADAEAVLGFYFERPDLSQFELTNHISPEDLALIQEYVNHHIDLISEPHVFVDKLKEVAKKNEVPLKCVYWFLRIALMGSMNGPAIHELLEMLGTEESRARIQKALA